MRDRASAAAPIIQLRRSPNGRDNLEITDHNGGYLRADADERLLRTVTPIPGPMPRGSPTMDPY